jgi:hypothetical protein
MDERNKDEEKKDVLEIVFLSLLNTAPTHKSLLRSVNLIDLIFKNLQKRT